MSQKSLNLVEKKNLVEYRKIYYRTRKIALLYFSKLWFFIRKSIKFF